ncbi:phosphoribosylanthranilate isomerase [Kineobactrum salinum]|uniref:N-(5'-phosphoribosyl)anthranilate isomerase n=1 Tax=Kineobactrum salinum TaxID=2708301 RepID=A0A6C0U8B0_9GAMM|nr:phosphoribosylanthranilate isomerase [Kineobactrum salinum]QIB67277.1 phosphoribosylanthranilate isomerase [Kineobactrum salinum]
MIAASFVSRKVTVSRTLIKICGITSADDALAACNAGADALGLVFYEPSPRGIRVQQARDIVAAIPPFVTVVALFVDESAAVIDRILEQVAVDCIQFHGSESAAFCEQFGRPYLKALRVRPGQDIAAACQRYPGARAVLLDSWQPDLPGGTGTTFDWGLAPARLARPLVLAGGLNDSNVGAAIRALAPAGVDVSGGVERAPGQKDIPKMSRFIAAVRAADLSDGAVQ